MLKVRDNTVHSAPADEAAASPEETAPLAPALPPLGNILQFVRFSHTIFALPFALAAMLLAAHGLPSGKTVTLILLCLVTARTAAMSFNRVADWDFDRLNPRTKERQRLVQRGFGWGLVAGNALLFVAATYWINPLCFALSPVALLLIFFYSLTKRFTAYTHLFLGLALAAAPMGAWAAVRGSLLELTPWVLATAVWLWVAGFDLIYATQDSEFDRKLGLNSIPARFGNAAAVHFAQVLHGLSWLALGALLWIAPLGWKYAVAWGVIGAALVYEHRLARTGDLRQINVAFFQVNAVVSLLVLVAVSVEIWT